MDAKRSLHRGIRKVFSFLPRGIRFAIYRSFVACDANPDPRLVLKIAETKEELESCFRLLHDAYVSSGFMTPDPSGMRITIYHALPTTTTLCAKFDGEVVGTISLIRESLFGFPLQAIFDLNQVRSLKGKIAEVSALAVHPKFRKTGGSILFPLMKFMYDYCTSFFDTRHLVIAVNPNRIEMYESLLFFQRLDENFVTNYDFANGAPAVGAALDLYDAPDVFKLAYGHKKLRKNLYQYFVKTTLPNIVVPNRRYYTTNDPVMTPELLDYFFNQQTQVFANLEDRKKGLLHDIYNLAPYKSVLPKLRVALPGEYCHRQHERYSVKCPGTFELTASHGHDAFKLMIIELSAYSFQATSPTALPFNAWGEANIQLGQHEESHVKVMVINDRHTQLGRSFTFKLSEPDLAWRKFFNALNAGITHHDLENATRFLPQ